VSPVRTSLLGALDPASPEQKCHGQRGQAHPMTMAPPQPPLVLELIAKVLLHVRHSDPAGPFHALEQGRRGQSGGAAALE
jgi:hypothetical protein